MADYNEFRYYPKSEEWETRYERHKYNEAFCKKCGSLVNISWGIKQHDAFHLEIIIGTF